MTSKTERIEALEEATANLIADHFNTSEDLAAFSGRLQFAETTIAGAVERLTSVESLKNHREVLNNHNARIEQNRAAIEDRVRVSDATIAQLQRTVLLVGRAHERIDETNTDRTKDRNDVERLRENVQRAHKLIAELENHVGTVGVETIARMDGDIEGTALIGQRTRAWLHGVENRVAKLVRKVARQEDRLNFHDSMIGALDSAIQHHVNRFSRIDGDIANVSRSSNAALGLVGDLRNEVAELRRQVEAHAADDWLHVLNEKPPIVVAGDCSAVEVRSINYGAVSVAIDASRLDKATAAESADCACETVDQCDGSCTAYENMMRDMYDPDAPINQVSRIDELIRHAGRDLEERERTMPVDLSAIRHNRSVAQDVPLRNAAATLRDVLDDEYRSAINDGCTRQEAVERVGLRTVRLRETLEAAYMDVQDAAMSSNDFGGR